MVLFSRKRRDQHSRSARGARRVPFCDARSVTSRPELSLRNESGTNRGRIADSALDAFVHADIWCALEHRPPYRERRRVARVFWTLKIVKRRRTPFPPFVKHECSPDFTVRARSPERACCCSRTAEW